MTDQTEYHLSRECRDYIGGWIVQEVETYKGKTVFDSDEEQIQEWSELNQEIISAMIDKALEAWNGGARDGDAE